MITTTVDWRLNRPGFDSSSSRHESVEVFRFSSFHQKKYSKLKLHLENIEGRATLGMYKSQPLKIPFSNLTLQGSLLYGLCFSVNSVNFEFVLIHLLRILILFSPPESNNEAQTSKGFAALTENMTALVGGVGGGFLAIMFGIIAIFCFFKKMHKNNSPGDTPSNSRPASQQEPAEMTAVRTSLCCPMDRQLVQGSGSRCPGSILSLSPIRSINELQKRPDKIPGGREEDNMQWTSILPRGSGSSPYHFILRVETQLHLVFSFILPSVFNPNSRHPRVHSQMLFYDFFFSY